MRLGQLARKYNIAQDEVILFLNEVQPELSPFHYNSKLSDQIEDLVISRFSSPEEDTEDTEEHSEDIATETNEQNLDLTEIDSDKEIEASIQRELDPTLPPIQTPETEMQDEKNAIETDRLLELLESDEESVDLSHITHIKAPKKELTGLTVLGKIELEEPKTKTAENTEEQEEVPGSNRKDKNQRPELNAEEKEARRLIFKERREKYEAQQAKLEKEKHQKEIKALNKARYEQQKVRRAKPIRTKQIDLIHEEQESIKIIDQRPIPKTIFGKFWRWLDASSK